MRGEFNLTAGQVLTIVVGQAVATIRLMTEAREVVGTFVISDNNNTSCRCRGGSGQGGDTHAQNAFRATSGGNGYSNELGGSNGTGGQGNYGSGGGFDGNGSGISFGSSYAFGLLGGDGNVKGGFGGVEAFGGSNDRGGGGGGYSGAARITREEAEAAHSIPETTNTTKKGMEMQMARFEFSEDKEPALEPQYPILNQNWVPTEDAKKVLIEALGRGIGLQPRWKSTKLVRQLLQ